MRTECGPKNAEDDDEPREARHQDDDCRRQREDGQQEQELDRQAVAFFVVRQPDTWKRAERVQHIHAACLILYRIWIGCSLSRGSRIGRYNLAPRNLRHERAKHQQCKQQEPGGKEKRMPIHRCPSCAKWPSRVYAPSTEEKLCLIRLGVESADSNSSARDDPSLSGVG